MKVVVDRIEENFAVCEKIDESNEEIQMIEIEISKLPEGTKEGDALIIEEEKISLDKEEKEKLEEEIEDIVKNLWDE